MTLGVIKMRRVFFVYYLVKIEKDYYDISFSVFITMTIISRLCFSDLFPSCPSLVSLDEDSKWNPSWRHPSYFRITTLRRRDFVGSARRHYRDAWLAVITGFLRADEFLLRPLTAARHESHFLFSSRLVRFVHFRDKRFLETTHYTYGQLQESQISNISYRWREMKNTMLIQLQSSIRATFKNVPTYYY